MTYFNIDGTLNLISFMLYTHLHIFQLLIYYCIDERLLMLLMYGNTPRYRTMFYIEKLQITLVLILKAKRLPRDVKIRYC